MKKISTFVNIFDFYGKQYGLYTNGENRYKTNFGAITGILSILIILALASYFVYETFLFTNVTVTNYLDEIKRPSNNLSQIPILFRFGDVTGQIIPPERLYNFELNHYEYTTELNSDKRVVKMKLTNLNYQICKAEDIKGYEEYFTNINLSNFYCIPTNKYNLTIYGKFGDISGGFSGLNFFIIKCENSTSQSKCLDLSQSNKILTGSKLVISHIDNRINPYNYSSPNEFYLKSTVYQISPHLIKRYFYNIQQNEYETDYGIIFENKITKTFFKYETISFNVDEEFQSLNGKPAISHVNFINSDYVSVTKRRYNKLQTFLANAGGMLNIILLISRYFVEILTDNFAWQEVINKIFTYDKDDLSYIHSSSEIKVEKNEVKKNLTFKMGTIKK
jgi:hypothetical protein